MEKYNKKGKICIKLVILCITCLLSLNLFSNANAIRKNVYGAKFSKANYSTAYPHATIQDLPIKDQTYLPITYVNIPADSIFQISSFRPEFTQSINIKKGRKFTYQINIVVGYKNYAGTGYQLSPIPQVQCPVGWSEYVIDKCDVSVEAIDSSVIRLYTRGQIEIPDSTELLSEAYSYNRWIMNIDGHWKGNDSTVTKFETAGTILSIYNPSPLALQNWDLIYTISFPTFYFYDEVESAEEETAQQELEDRDNLETQSTETNSDANSSSQDIGTATTNITGVISAFVGNLQNLNANNCTLPEITAYGFSLGQMNLCTFSPPSWIAGVTNVVVSLITLGLAYHLFRRIMGIAKSLAGGK